jgi:hypothetical protein
MVMLDEDCDQACIFGVFMYLAANTRPDSAYDVHQAAQHAHAHRASHAVAIKHILRYIKGMKENGILFKPDKNEWVD